jgi:hypothetical protein
MSLAACTTVVDQSDSLGALRVDAVTVDASSAIIEGRELQMTSAAVSQLFEAEIVNVVAQSSDPNGTPARVDVVMTQIRLAPPLERVVAGTSTATGILTVSHAETGERLAPSTPVTGTSENIRAAGVIALATTVAPEEDYRGTVRGFAEAIRQTLFGSET